MGAFRRIDQTGGAICMMKVKNQRSKHEEIIDCSVIHTGFDIHSFFFDKPIEMKRGDPMQFNPVNPLGELYEISSKSQEFCGSDGTVFNLSCLNNCIAALYYL